MNTLNLGLPTWDEGNTEPDLVFNQLLFVVDALLKSGVQDILSTPPATPVVGETWLVGDTATGAWAGHENDIAIAVTGGSGWYFITPESGWAMWVQSEAATFRFTTAWTE